MNRKLSVRLTTAALAILIAIAFMPLLAGGRSYAATKTSSYTVYTHESFSFYGVGKVKSVKSSNSKRVSAKKDGKYNVKLTTKKTGKATITVRGSLGTRKLRLTVKKLNIRASFAGRTPDGYLMTKFKNRNSHIFDQIQYKYTLKDSAGTTLKTGTSVLFGMKAKGTMYGDSVIPVGISDQVDMSKSTIKVTAATHNPDAKYTTVTKKVPITKKKVFDDGSSRIVQPTFKNKTSKNVSVRGYVLFYDAGGKILDAERIYLNLSSKQTNSTKVYVSYYAKGFARYKVFYHAYYYK